jgi:hypothetical protein
MARQDFLRRWMPLQRDLDEQEMLPPSGSI